MIVVLEFDWRGSWRPRREDLGAMVRYIGGPVSVAVMRTDFAGFMGCVERMAAEKMLTDAIARRAEAGMRARSPIELKLEGLARGKRSG